VKNSSLDLHQIQTFALDEFDEEIFTGPALNLNICFMGS